MSLMFHILKVKKYDMDFYVYRCIPKEQNPPLHMMATKLRPKSFNLSIIVEKMAEKGLPFPFQNSILDFHFHSGFQTSILADHTSILELHMFILRMHV